MPDALLQFLTSGLVGLGWPGLLVVLLVFTQLTIFSVTLFLHRSQAHRGVDFHPVLNHFFRFWTWLTTSMITREWVAIHRKHHAKCETPDDPHSPQTRGLQAVLWRGAELYRAEAEKPDTLAKFGRGTPDDWLERHVYTRRASWGIALMLLIDVALLGVAGLAVWAVQMAWIPFWSAMSIRAAPPGALRSCC